MQPTHARSHADVELLLLLSLGGEIAPALRDALEAHFAGCASCADRLESLLEARLGDEAASGLEPLHAAASATRKWVAPEPLQACGKLSGVLVYRLPGETPRFGVDERAWVGRTLRIKVPGEASVEARVDDFRRLLVGDQGPRLAAALALTPELEVELVEP